MADSLNNLKKNFSNKGVMFFIIMFIVTAIFTLALGGALLLQKYVLNVIIAFVTTVAGILGGRMFLQGNKKRK